MGEIIKLCGKSSGCCPTIEMLDDDNFIVKDDYDGKVKLTKEEIRILYEASGGK